MFNDLWATFSQQFPDNFASLLTVSTVETIYMSVSVSYTHLTLPTT